MEILSTENRNRGGTARDLRYVSTIFGTLAPRSYSQKVYTLSSFRSFWVTQRSRSLWICTVTSYPPWEIRRGRPWKRRCPKLPLGCRRVVVKGAPVQCRSS